MDNRPYDEGANPLRIAQLTDRGVDVWGSHKVYIGEEVDVDNIEPGAVLYDAVITGESTRIGAGSRIGVSGAARLHECQLGRDVELGAGTYESATLLDGAKVRGFAELRPGTLLEEEAEAAHSTAFKNTILTAGAVAGSLINFCDAFLSGGTSRSDHSEIGSGAVHFNFDPRGDKWGSMFGDASGVLLRSAPIFVGGQCGLIAPLHVDFGAVIAAGSMVRRDVGRDCVKFETAPAGVVSGFDREIYQSLRRRFLSTAQLIGTLWAFQAWYEDVRLAYANARLKPLYQAGKEQAAAHVTERAQRLDKIIAKLPRSLEKTGSQAPSDERRDPRTEHRLMIDRRDEILGAMTRAPASPPPAVFLEQYQDAVVDSDHMAAVRSLDDQGANAAADWLRGIARSYQDDMVRLLS